MLTCLGRRVDAHCQWKKHYSVVGLLGLGAPDHHKTMLLSADFQVPHEWYNKAEERDADATVVATSSKYSWYLHHCALHSLNVLEQTGEMNSATFYPALVRFEEQNLLSSYSSI